MTNQTSSTAVPLREQLINLAIDHKVHIKGLQSEYFDELVQLIKVHEAAIKEQIEIDLLRDTAQGFEQELLPEYEKGGRAAINALRAMADHKEARPCKGKDGAGDAS